MIYLYAFIVSGLFCVIAQIIYDHTKLTAGHITSLFVVVGAVLSALGIYDILLDFAQAGASISITNFGHLLVQGGLEGMKENGIFGLLLGLFSKSSATLASTIFVAGLASLLFKPKP